MAITLQKLQLQPFWKNPVVVRDMRVRLRGARAFWNQAAYLGLLCLIALLGYGLSVQTSSGEALDPVAAQRDLQGFYYTIFVTVAILISLIAPGLTAVSIISERQRLTLDLLVTTPMTSMQMLLGKLMSSIAFIVLLLVLSVPISSLCVILGGATIGDVLQTYALLAIDGIVLASIGLAYSCSAKQNVQAIVGTYGSIVLYFVVTFVAGAASLNSLGLFGGGAGHGSGPMPSVAAILYLNPIVTIYAPGHGVDILGLTVPPWIATGVAAFLIVRLILTGAALRLGLYGAGLVASLRRQVLLCTGVAVFLIAQSILQLSVGWTPEVAEGVMVVLCCVVFALSLFFLPALFVPVADPDAPVASEVKGRYDLRRAFSAMHSGALPFFHLWLTVVAFCALAGAWSGTGSPLSAFGMGHIVGPPKPVAVPLLVKSMALGCGAALVYTSGLGFLLWSLSRRASWLAGSFTAARPLAFLFFVFVVAIPFAIMLVMSQMHPDSTTDPFSTSWLRYLWLAYPFNSLDNGATVFRRMLGTGALAYFYGVLAYPFWRGVVPGAGAIFKKRDAPPQAVAGVS